ncbi:hypothetical protein GN244_ATG10933 [Phytophthora infestans]|uniref:Uncharacterized protein n=1 Tax=Phytophthora infestans TaxID=4787 RepID=A0A833SN82_PHYIN|nr:hypothetical protein GN244_ATG10933 [Phytophthora infestans]
MKILDDIQSALQDSNTKPMTRRFTEWYKSGKTPDEFSAAIAQIKIESKRKGFGALHSHYRMFVQYEVNKAKRAAEAAAKKAAEAAAAI